MSHSRNTIALRIIFAHTHATCTERRNEAIAYANRQAIGHVHDAHICSVNNKAECAKAFCIFQFAMHTNVRTPHALLC